MSRLHQIMAEQGHSPHFFTFIRSVGSSKSRQQESKVVSKDIKELKAELSGRKKLVDRQLKECVIRCCYSEMMGFSADFAYIYCVNLTSSHDLLCKRTGYFASVCSISPESDLMYLLVANIQRDLKSTNYLEVSAGLTACRRLIPNELIDTVADDVLPLLEHKSALVRKKAVLAMHAFYQRSNGAVFNLAKLRAVICDKDPSVMGASLHFLYDVCISSRGSQSDTLPALVSIFEQIISERLPYEFAFHHVPAPWMQLQLLKLIGVIAADGNRDVMAILEPFLIKALSKANLASNIGCAIAAEVISVGAAVAPGQALMEAAAEATGTMLQTANPNIKCMGLSTLSRIAAVDPSYVQQYQMLIMTCLEDPNENIRNETRLLLIALCNESNVEAIVGRLIKLIIHKSVYQEALGELVRNVILVAQQFHTDRQWFVDAMNALLEAAGPYVPREALQVMLKFIAEDALTDTESPVASGSDAGESSSVQLRRYCVDLYFHKMGGLQNIGGKCESLLQVAAWTIGEYGFLSQTVEMDLLLERLCDMIDKTSSALTKGWIVSAMAKLIAQIQKIPSDVRLVVEALASSRSIGLQQRACEILSLVNNMNTMKCALPQDACCEEVIVDPAMSFMYPYIENAIATGEKLYVSGPDASLCVDQEHTTVWRTSAYEAQEEPPPIGFFIPDSSSLSLSAEQVEVEPSSVSIRPVKAKRWGVENLTPSPQEDEPVVEPLENVIGSIPVSKAESLNLELTPTLSFADKPYTSINPSAKESRESSQQPSANVSPHLQARPAKVREMDKFLGDVFAFGKKKRKNTVIGASKAPLILSTEKQSQYDNSAVSFNLQKKKENDLTDLFSDVPTNTSAKSVQPTFSPSENYIEKSNSCNAQLDAQLAAAGKEIVVRLHFMTSLAVSNVDIALNVPSCAIVTSASCDVANYTISNSVIHIPAVPLSFGCSVDYHVAFKTFPGRPEELFIDAVTNYFIQGMSEPSTVQTRIPFTITQILHPLQITPQEFAKQWSALALNGQSTCTITLKQAVPDELARHLISRAQLQLLAISGRKAFAAASLIGSKLLILCQLELNGKSVHVSLRAESESFLRIITELLSK